jgi:hypothetical protein
VSDFGREEADGDYRVVQFAMKFVFSLLIQT